ncbi:hypothetical protein Bca52824_085444 [Brassica carinata]|uniref:Late embryogenesis abundant protein LEA-2 subgroup domain-containing protein n=1 Tax=Brassica carinata TaxID=52824 RepID=A0A8X7P613_BRACI|nr:hypothetical protein Bca52824_085444 [Brassica carinata]
MERREEHYSNYFVQSSSSLFHDAESEFQSPYQSDSVRLRYSDFLKYFEDDNEKRLMPLRSLNSGWWIVLQILWRFLFSSGVALLVFYIATQPTRPDDISIRIGRFNQFLLEEGVDSRGVSTVFLTCNCSTKLIVDNKSYVFGLHIHPPSIKLFFGPLNFSKAQNQTMYGAGRQMEDMLQSRAGLPLILRMNLISDFRVVWSIINPMYHHNVECLLFLSYNKKHKQTTVVKEKCRLVS